MSTSNQEPQAEPLAQPRSEPMRPLQPPTDAALARPQASPTPGGTLPPSPSVGAQGANEPTPPILVATSDQALARILTFALEQLRLPFRLIDSGTDALRELLAMRVGSQAPIVVLDVDLPGVDGHAILERLGVDRPDTFLILVLSSHADESVQVRSLLAGALDHLAKPFNVRVLMAKIQRWVAMSSRVAGAA